MRTLLLLLAILAVFLSVGNAERPVEHSLEPLDTGTTCLAIAVWSVAVLGLRHRARRR